MGELPGAYDVEAETYLQALEHQDAYNPDEPYRGVGALFNADLHRTSPQYAPREHWEAANSNHIYHRPLHDIIAGVGIAALD